MATRSVRLTQDGYDRLKTTLEQEYVRLDEATTILRELTGSSDDYDDSGLEEAKQEKGRIENRIDDLEDQLARAVIIKAHEDGRIDLGGPGGCGVSRDIRQNQIAPGSVVGYAGNAPTTISKIELTSLQAHQRAQPDCRAVHEGIGRTISKTDRGAIAVGDIGQLVQCSIGRHLTAQDDGVVFR